MPTPTTPRSPQARPRTSPPLRTPHKVTPRSGPNTRRPSRNEKVGNALDHAADAARHLDPMGKVVPPGGADALEAAGHAARSGVKPRTAGAVVKGSAKASGQGAWDSVKSGAGKAWDATKRAAKWAGGQVNEFNKSLDQSASKIGQSTGVGGSAGGLGGAAEVGAAFG